MQCGILNKGIIATLTLMLMATVITGCGQKVATETNADNAATESVATSTSESVIAFEQEDTDQNTTEENDATYQEVFKTFANDYYEKHKDQEDEYSKLNFGLIYFDDDDIPELVLGLNGYYVYLYKYDNGKLITIMDNWAYGVGGNPGYDYVPKSGIIYNSNSDMAGGEVYETYYKWNAESGELESLYDEVLMMRHFDDINGDGNYDWSDLEEGGYLDEPFYFVGDREVSKEEYDSYRYAGEFEPICGDMTIDELNSKLE